MSLNISLEATDQKTHCFKDILQPYPSLKRLDIGFRCYSDSIPCGYFDFTNYPKDVRLAIQARVPDTETYIEAPVSVACDVKVSASDQTSA